MANILSSLVVAIKGDNSDLVGKLQESKEHVGGFGDTLGKVGSVAAVGAGLGVAAIAGIGVAALAAGDDARNATNLLQTQLGLTRTEAETLGGVAQQVFRDNFGASITEAASAVGLAQQQLAGLGVTSSTELQTVAENAFRVRDAFGVEMPQSIDAAKTLMTNFGLTSDQAFDLITAGFQNGLNRSGDFLESITEYGPQFSSGGATATEFFSVLDSGLQGGVLGTDRAADAFKEFRVRIQDGSKLTSESLQMLGIDSEDLSRKMADGSMTAADAFKLVTQRLQETDDKNVQMQAGVGLLGTQFEDLGTQGATSLTMISDKYADVEGKTASLDAQYNNLGSVFETLKRKAIVDFLVPLGDMALDFANNQGPKIAEVFDRVSEVIGQVIDWLRTNWPEIQTVIADTFGPFVEEVMQTVEAVRGHLDALIATVREHWDQIEPIVTPVLEFLKVAIPAALNVVKEAVMLVMNLIQGDWSGAWDNIKAIAENVWTLIKAAIKLAIDAIPAIIELGMNLIKAAFEAGWNALKDEVLPAAWEGIKSGIRTGISEAVALVGELPGKITGAIPDLSRVLYNAGKQVIAGLLQGIRDMIPDLDGLLGSIADRIPIKKGPEDKDRALLHPAGVAIMEGLNQGIVDGSADVFATLDALTAGILKQVMETVNAARELMIAGAAAILNPMALQGFGEVGTGGDEQYISKHKPGMATGGRVLQGGAFRVGEFGPETVYLPSGAVVNPAGAEAGGGRPVTLNFHGPVYGADDLRAKVIGMLRDARRRGEAADVLGAV